jgi:guanosine-3',5'-bis(diphosphate) 3'-pyrophosphohydrolase
MSCEAVLIEKISQYIDLTTGRDLLDRACIVTKEWHGSQKRASGEPYYNHPFEVAIIMAEMRMDMASIITALLHDTVEDTEATLDDIEKIFGKEIALLVDGVTKLAKIEFQSDHVRQAENFRKLIIAMSEDIRVLLVKLADRLHNMRTLHYIKSPEKRVRIAHETMEIYAPLAERIGMQKLKNEMQDLAFAVLHPEVRDSILSRLDYLRQKGAIVVERIVEDIQARLASANIECVVKGREKTPYSIWRKMERKNISFEMLADIMAFRVIVADVVCCYQVLGVIHSAYQAVPDSFKDFISTPKENGYQSLHTIVMGPEKRFIEIQIRTPEMHAVADFGVAAHWGYKQQNALTSKDGKQYRWLRELLSILEHATDPEEFLENTKLEMYYDQVFCFTPKGDLIALPRAATPVDFAFAVHSDVGHHCAGAKINGRIVPLRTPLNNGDQVEIITSKTQMPSPAWEKFVVTGKARSEIKRFVRARKREEYIKLGRSMLAKALKEEGQEIHDDTFKSILDVFAKKNVADFYAVVGEGMLSIQEVIRALYPNRTKTKKRQNPLHFFRGGREKQGEDSIPIKGLIPGMAVHFAGCCHPIPGDKIVGIVNTGKGVTIHTVDCDLLENFVGTPERWIDVSWDKDSSERHHIGRVKIILAHESGSLASIASTVAKDMGNINNLRITNRSPDFFELLVDVDVRGAEHLSDIIASLRAQACVHAVERYRQ